jgi:hypothetical protein
MQLDGLSRLEGGAVLAGIRCPGEPVIAEAPLRIAARICRIRVDAQRSALAAGVGSGEFRPGVVDEILVFGDGAGIGGDRRLFAWRESNAESSVTLSLFL